MLRSALAVISLSLMLLGCSSASRDPTADNLPPGVPEGGADVIDTVEALEIFAIICGRDPGFGALGAVNRLGQLGLVSHYDGPLDGAYSNTRKEGVLPSLVFRFIPPKRDRRGNELEPPHCKMAWTTSESEDAVEAILGQIDFRYSKLPTAQMVLGKRSNVIFHWETQRVHGVNVFFLTAFPNWQY